MNLKEKNENQENIDLGVLFTENELKKNSHPGNSHSSNSPWKIPTEKISAQKIPTWNIPAHVFKYSNPIV